MDPIYTRIEQRLDSFEKSRYWVGPSIALSGCLTGANVSAKKNVIIKAPNVDGHSYIVACASKQPLIISLKFISGHYGRPVNKLSKIRNYSLSC
jgi:hypothetical protein